MNDREESRYSSDIKADFTGLRKDHDQDRLSILCEQCCKIDFKGLLEEAKLNKPKSNETGKYRLRSYSRDFKLSTVPPKVGGVQNTSACEVSRFFQNILDSKDAGDKRHTKYKVLHPKIGLDAKYNDSPQYFDGGYKTASHGTGIKPDFVTLNYKSGRSIVFELNRRSGVADQRLPLKQRYFSILDTSRERKRTAFSDPPLTVAHIINVRRANFNLLKCWLDICNSRHPCTLVDDVRRLADLFLVRFGG